MVPTEIARAYGFGDQPIAPLSGGLINQTFLVGPPMAPIAVIQKLHSVFEMTVNLDIEKVTERLASVGLATPRLIRTTTGDAWIDRWRAITFVPGSSTAVVQSPEQARSAGVLIGRFHSALSDWDYDFQFVRSGVHDTQAHLQALTSRLGDAEGREPIPGARRLGTQILEAASALAPLPDRTWKCHGDLKISNIRFDQGGKATCLLDLDTLGNQTIAYELGDAMRSWCNRASEEEPPQFEPQILIAALRGYRQTMPAVSEVELASVPDGTHAVSLELAARFCADVFDDSYFGWDASRFTSRRAHNLARAASMLSLATAVHECRDELIARIKVDVKTDT